MLKHMQLRLKFFNIQAQTVNIWFNFIYRTYG